MELPPSAPRVYVPITSPDSPVPTYAVLQFLGFSSPNLPPLPPQLPSPFSLRPLQEFPPVSPSSRSSAAESSSENSRDSKEREKKDVKEKEKDIEKEKDTEKERTALSIRPCTMKKSGVTGGIPCATSPKSSPGNRAAVGISVSQTERETIVHTDSSNFREIVHQLTGASSEDKDLLPVTLPSRFVNRSGDGGFNMQEINMSKSEFGCSNLGSRAPDLGPRKSATKLLERRKSMKNLERLTTNCRDLPPLVPSPVTPLASDFEKICLPLTPTTSQGSATVHKKNDAIRPHQVISQDLAIPEQNFFLHSERPSKSTPPLLHLFPESPREQ